MAKPKTEATRGPGGSSTYCPSCGGQTFRLRYQRRAQPEPGQERGDRATRGSPFTYCEKCDEAHRQ